MKKDMKKDSCLLSKYKDATLNYVVIMTFDCESLKMIVGFYGFNWKFEDIYGDPQTSN